MSKTSMNHDGRTSLQVVLQKCISWEEAFKNSFVHHMCEKGLICKDIQNQIAELEEKDQISRITKSVTDYVYEDRTTCQTLTEFLGVSEVDSAAISLISLIVESDLPESLLSLIEKWDKLVELEKELTEDIVDLDPKYKNSDNCWPLGFIHFCAKSENQDFLKNLCDNGKTFQKLCCHIHEWEIPNTNDEELSGKDSDDGLESFDIISEDGSDIREGIHSVDERGITEVDRFDEVSSPEDTSESSTEEDNSKEKEPITKIQIEKIGEVLKLIVKYLWPENEELSVAKNWPTLLMATVLDNQDSQLCSQFTNVVKSLLKWKEEYSHADFPSLPSLDVESANDWITECCDAFLRFEKGLSMFLLLFQMGWPDVGLVETDSLKTKLLEKYDLDRTRTTNFVNVAQVLLRYLMKNDDEANSLLDEDDQLSVGMNENSDASSESDSDLDVVGCVVKNVIKSVGGHLLPFVKLAWPEDFELFKDEDLTTHLISTLNDEDDVELSQQFISVCKLISELSGEGTDFSDMSFVKCESAKSWISSTSQQFLLSEKRKSAFSMLFELTWPDLQPFSIDMGPSVLAKQYHKNEERATDFVYAAQVFLELLKFSESKIADMEIKDDQISENQKTGGSGTNPQILFLESRREEISQSRHVLLPFVKLFWPDHARISDEETWPGELIAAVAGSTIPSSPTGLSFIDIFKDVLEMKKRVGHEQWPESVDSKSARDWIITISDRTELLSKWSTHIDTFLCVTWPDIESVSIHGWTRTLLRKHKCDEVRTEDFVNAVQMFYTLLMAQPSEAVLAKPDSEKILSSSHPKVKVYHVAENSKATFLKNYYDEINSAKNLLLPVIELMYFKKNEIMEDENWPNEFIATVLEDNEWNCQIFVSVLQHILDMKKAVPDYATERSTLEVSEVFKWFTNIVGSLNDLDKDTPLFYRLYQLTWPNSTDKKMKTKHIKSSCVDDPIRTMIFARAIELLFPLKQKFQEQEKAAKKRLKKSKKSSKIAAVITGAGAGGQKHYHTSGQDKALSIIFNLFLFFVVLPENST